MMSSFLGRWILTPEGPKKGYLRMEGDSVVEVCDGDAPSYSSKTIVLPSFVNAHTHIGDSVAYPAPRGSLEEIVAPPSGYKHRVLRATSRSAKIDAMRHSAMFMAATGTSHFIDYREEGLEGIRALSEALVDIYPRAVVLGRPLSSGDSDNELQSILAECNGMGMSALSDWPFDFLARTSKHAKGLGKVFSIHASEAVREDIDEILDLKPDFLVHMVKASDSDLERCSDAGVPIVVCPSSNAFFGQGADIPKLQRLGIAVALGTDNCMIAKPDMLAELKMAYRSRSKNDGITPLEAISLATFGGRKVLNPAAKITRITEATDDLSVVAVAGDDPISSLVSSTSSKDIQVIIHGGKVWRPETWRA